MCAYARPVVNNCKGPNEIGNNVSKRPVEGSFAGDDNVVEANFRLQFRELSDRGFEATADTISYDGVANFFCDREAKARTVDAIKTSLPFARFDQARRYRRPRSAANGEKLRANFECFDLRNGARPPGSTSPRRCF